MFSENNRSF